MYVKDRVKGGGQMAVVRNFTVGCIFQLRTPVANFSAEKRVFTCLVSFVLINYASNKKVNAKLTTLMFYLGICRKIFVNNNK